MTYHTWGAVVCAETMTDQIGSLREELHRLDGEVARLANAIAAGGDLAALIAARKERERRQQRIRAELAALDRATMKAAPRFDVRAASAKLRDHLTDWQGMLRQEGPQSRHGLTALLTGRLSFEPKGKDKDRYYEFSGPSSPGKIVAGGWRYQRSWCPRGDSNTRHAV
jgi:hypothetical protein